MIYKRYLKESYKQGKDTILVLVSSVPKGDFIGTSWQLNDDLLVSKADFGSCVVANSSKRGGLVNITGYNTTNHSIRDVKTDKISLVLAEYTPCKEKIDDISKFKSGNYGILVKNDEIAYLNFKNNKLFLGRFRLHEVECNIDSFPISNEIALTLPKPLDFIESGTYKLYRKQ